MKISELFEDEPVQWGLRGDPFLWRELKETFKETKVPESPSELQLLIEREYEKSTGRPISYQEQFVVERFRSHGMSSGGVSPDFWVNIGIPLLVGRHAKY